MGHNGQFWLHAFIYKKKKNCAAKGHMHSDLERSCNWSAMHGLKRTRIKFLSHSGLSMANMLEVKLRHVKCISLWTLGMLWYKLACLSCLKCAYRIFFTGKSNIAYLLPIVAMTTDNPVYLISTWDAGRVWPVSRGWLPFLGTWSYLRICQRSVLPFTRFRNCLLDYGYLLHIVNFAILYSTWNDHFLPN
jgi:hypothetical protein